MKVNSVGIDAYRQTMEKPQVNKQAVADRQQQVEKTQKVQVPVQTNKVSSKLGVKLQAGTFDDMLSDEERQAIEMVFSRFRNIAGSYTNDGTNESSTLGNFVDVKL